MLLGACEQYVIGQAAVLLGELTAETKSAGLPMESDADDRGPSIDSTLLTWQVSGWSSASMVDDTGIEPVTSSVSGWIRGLGWCVAFADFLLTAPVGVDSRTTRPRASPNHASRFVAVL